MANTKNVFSIFFVTLFFSAAFTFHLAGAAVTSVFMFGDSTVDVGTNTFLTHGEPKAGYPYFGIHFPHSIATERVTNGLNIADFLAMLTAFKISPPPYLALVSLPDCFENHKFKGVNFASGGAGLVDPIGDVQHLISVTEQIEQFATVINKLKAVRGRKATQEKISKSIFYISMGGREMFNHFFSNSTVPPQQATAIQMSQYETYLKALYNLGARNFGIASVLAVGYSPAIRLHNITGGCADSLNGFSQSFYSALRALLSSLSSQLEGMKYSLGITYELFFHDSTRYVTPINFCQLVEGINQEVVTSQQVAAE